MKRIVLWALSTVSCLVLLFSYHTSTSGVVAAKAPTSVQAPVTSGGTASSNGSTVTGDVASTEWGPVQVQLTLKAGKIAEVSVVRYPNGNGRDAQINGYALPILTQETVDAQSASIDMVSGATVTSEGYLTSLQSALDKAGTVSTTTELPVHRAVEQLMGMPVSLALRGRHSDDDLASQAWADALSVLCEADRMFSPYSASSLVSRLDRDELPTREWTPELAEILDLGERARVESDGAFDVYRRDATGRVTLDPSGVVKGWAVERAARALARLPETDFCLSAGGDLQCGTATPGSAGWRIGIEDPFDSSRIVAVVPVRNGAVATSGLSHRGAHIVDARTGSTPTQVASVTVVGPSLTWADIDATAAFAKGCDALTWLNGRQGRSGLVVWADGTRELFGEPGHAGTLG